MSKLPVLLSIPHGGMATPPELQDRVCISKHDLHDDIDPFVNEIYDLDGHVEEVVSTDIARTFVDLNRAPDDRPPKNPDGVIKSATCFRKPIYLEWQEPEPGLIEDLLRRYYYPYHQKIQRAVQRAEIELGLDCHSMLAVGPDISPDTGRKRPIVCLGNVHGKTCSNDQLARLLACFQEAFSVTDGQVSMNQPFAGGYITRTYGNHPIPWIQVELNRSLYLDPKYFDRKTLRVEPSRLRELREKFEHALRLFVGSHQTSSKKTF